MSIYYNRDVQVRVERNLTALLKRIDRLKSVGVTVPMVERDELAKAVRQLRESIEAIQQRDPSWEPKR